MLSAQPRGDASRLVAVAVATTRLRAFVAARAEHLTELLLKHRLDRFEHTAAQQILNVPA